MTPEVFTESENMSRTSVYVDVCKFLSSTFPFQLCTVCKNFRYFYLSIYMYVVPIPAPFLKGVYTAYEGRYSNEPVFRLLIW